MMSIENRDELLPLFAMARALRVTQGWLKSEAEAGRVPALKAGNRFLFSRAAVERALLEQAGSREFVRQLTGEPEPDLVESEQAEFIARLRGDD